MTEKVFKPHPDFQAISESWRKKWSDALRSGDYEQCQSRLEKDGRFCCKGVLQKIHGKPTYTPEGKTIGMPSKTYDAVKWGGRLIENMSLASLDGICMEAWLLNDVHNLTFPQIADLIDGKEVVESE